MNCYRRLPLLLQQHLVLLVVMIPPLPLPLPALKFPAVLFPAAIMLLLLLLLQGLQIVSHRQIGCRFLATQFPVCVLHLSCQQQYPQR